MTKTGYIYGLSFGGGEIRYVGMTTTSPRRRLSQHVNEAKRGNHNRSVHNWIRVHNFDVSVEIIETVVSEDAGELGRREVFHIARLNSLASKPLLNLTVGGDGGARSKPYSDDAIRKYSETKTGNLNPMYGKRGPDNPNYGRSFTEEARAKMSEAKTGERHPNYGKSLSQETKDRISAKAKERWAKKKLAAASA